MRSFLVLACLASATLAREEGLFRGASVSEVQDLYGNSCPKRQGQCQTALASVTASSRNVRDMPSFNFLQTIAEDPGVWSKVRKLRHMAANLERWTPDRLDLSVRKLLRLAQAMSQFLSEAWNVSLSTPVQILEALVTQQTPDAFFVATYMRALLQDVVKTILTVALVPDADVKCEIQTWTCEYHRMLSIVLPQLDSENTLQSAA